MILVLPLFLLTTAWYSILVYQRTSGELARVLAAGTAAVCLIWGFAIAHWSVQILGLLLLVQSKRLSLLWGTVRANN
ncbi:MAG: hypothetical protein SVX43_18110 [Cyanobacteriota bacterium]|nr:hypothetical protein [Cyanobacteriota bacterium]